MAGVIAQRILRHRKKLKVTQDQLGADYNVSGPAVFKFEKGYVVPSLRLWLRLADDMNIDRRTAVLMYVQDRLPEQYKNYARWDSMVAEGGLKGPEYEDFAKHKSEDALKKAIVKNNWLPSGLIDFARSKEVWAMYHPTGKEINVLRDIFMPLGEGTKRDFCDGLRLLRAVMGKNRMSLFFYPCP